MQDRAEPTGCPWAWEDRDAGIVRLRVFGAAVGVDEDPATGSAALVLAAALRRPITIVQGAGSVISAAPQPDGNVEVGGHVVLDQQRSFAVADD